MAYDKVVDSSFLNAGLTSIANKIRSRSGGSSQLAFPTGFVSEIDNIPSSAPITEQDVNFYDYDGTLLYSYTVSEFASLSAMPANPSHTGLTAQGWNWDLATAKTYVASYTKLNIGQMYTTSDGATRIYFKVGSRKTVYLNFRASGNVTINWGDGSAADTVSGRSMGTNITQSHTYSASGDYVISILPDEGVNITFGNGSNQSSILNVMSSNTQGRTFLNTVKKIECGRGFIFYRYATGPFFGINNLETITLPSMEGVDASYSWVPQYGFQECYKLKFITIPKGMTILDGQSFQECHDLKNVVLPSGIVQINASAFYNCRKLNGITIPDTITQYNSKVFYSCEGLERIVITGTAPNLNNQLFDHCYNLKSAQVPAASILKTSMYNSCSCLETFNIPTGGTEIPSSFAYCDSIEEVVIPSGIETINGSFNSCRGLTKVTIPATVTSIKSSAFASCYSLKEMHLLGSTPPTLGSQNDIAGFPTDFVIYVPTGSLATYQGTTNWSAFASYMQEE